MAFIAALFTLVLIACFGPVIGMAPAAWLIGGGAAVAAVVLTVKQINSITKSDWL